MGILSIKVLDCTFRDGGYYTNWHFDLNLVRDYLGVMERSGIEAIEIGFRSPDGYGFSKATDEFIENNLRRPDVKYFGVMVNATSFAKHLFKDRYKSPINFVRVATYFKDIDSAERVCKELKELNYLVCCNLMQAGILGYDEISEAVEKIQSWDAVDVLYIADSLGGMNGHDIDEVYLALATEWDGSIGFHAHNNQCKALANSLYAVEYGFDWVDSTILGMGRGAGNTETEYLLTELGGYKVDEVYELVTKFLPLKREHKWGTNLFYYLAAENNIHPTYIQKLLSTDANIRDWNENHRIILKAIKLLKNENFYKEKV